MKLDGWGDAATARAILVEAMDRYQASADKPNF